MGSSGGPQLVDSQPQQHMLSPDVVMSQVPGFLLSQDDDLTRLLCEPIKHV